MTLSKVAIPFAALSLSEASWVNSTLSDACGDAYAPISTCPPGSSPGTPQTNWQVSSTRKCAGPCDGYSTLQWTSNGDATTVIQNRNSGNLISTQNQIPQTIEELKEWFLPEFSWGYQNPGPAPPWNPQPEAAYLDDAGNGLCGGLPGPDTTVATCCQEETTCEMMQLRHFIFKPPGCSGVDVNYNSPNNAGRVFLTKTSDRGGALPSSKHEACMCGDRQPQHQSPFYYFVVKGPEKDNTKPELQKWLTGLRTAYNNLFDIWSQRPPCSGECLIMAGASDAWESYAHSTARSVYFQLRAFAAFDPHALPNACGAKGVMLRFGGMTLNADGTATCYGSDHSWGQTGAGCPVEGKIEPDFNKLVTQVDDDNFFAQAGAPGDLLLETDSAVVKISAESGVRVEHKQRTCPQPTLDFAWRCQQQGGVSDSAACGSSPPAPPTPPTPPTPITPPTPAPPTPPSPPGPQCQVGDGVQCPGSDRGCAGDQCCPDGSACPSAREDFTGCAKAKDYDCLKPSVSEAELVV